MSARSRSGLRSKRFAQPSAQGVVEAEQNLKFKDVFRVGFSDLHQLTRFLSSDMTRYGVETEKADVWAKSLLYSAQTHDVNPLILYAVVRHESGDFSAKLQAEGAGNYLYPARRDNAGRVVDVGVFGVAQVKYDAHRGSVPWAELTLQRITGAQVDLLNAAAKSDSRTVSAISLLIGGKVLKKALNSAPTQIVKSRLQGTSPVVAAFQIYNRGTLKNHDTRTRYASRVLTRWRRVSQDAARFLGIEAAAATAPIKLAANDKEKAVARDQRDAPGGL